MNYNGKLHLTHFQLRWAGLHFKIFIGSQRYSTRESDFPNNFQEKGYTLLLTYYAIFVFPVSSLFPKSFQQTLNTIQILRWSAWHIATKDPTSCVEIMIYKTCLQQALELILTQPSRRIMSKVDKTQQHSEQQAEGAVTQKNIC